MGNSLNIHDLCCYRSSTGHANAANSTNNGQHLEK